MGAVQVLIVEDNDDIRELLADVLTVDGHAVVCASNGQEALAHLRASRRLPNVILLDVQMPIVDGFEFRAEQNRDPNLAAIPVILMTAEHETRHKVSCIKPDICIRKPFKDLHTIRAAVKQLSGRGPTGQSS